MAKQQVNSATRISRREFLQTGRSSFRISFPLCSQPRASFTPNPKDLRQRKSKLLYSSFASFDSFDESSDKEEQVCSGSKEFQCYCTKVCSSLWTPAFKKPRLIISHWICYGDNQKTKRLSNKNMTFRLRTRRSFERKQTTFVKSFTIPTQIFRCSIRTILNLILYVSQSHAWALSSNIVCSWVTPQFAWWSRGLCIKPGCLRVGRSTGKDRDTKKTAAK